MTKHALYRFYTDLGELLYVGITNRPERRFSEHAERKPWWPDVRGISIEWHDDRLDVEAAERRAIRVEKPRYNIARGEPRPPKRAPACGHCWECRDGGACVLNAPIDDGELETCPVCGRRDCLFGLGYDWGSQAGWSAAYERRKEE